MVDMSIIVPVYNCSGFISKCLESLLAQKGSIEIILINDASKDNSLDIICEYASKDSRIIIINNEYNIGAAMSRNRGLDVVTGKYVMFVDSDDYIEIGAVSELIDSMEKHQVDMSYIGMESFSDEGQMKDVEGSIRGTYNDVYLGEELLKSFIENSEFFLYLCSVCYKREFLEKYKLHYQDIRIGEGGDFILRALLNANRVIVNPKILYHYRVHKNSITHQSFFKQEILYGQVRQYFSVLDIYQKNVDSKACDIALGYLYRKILGGIQTNSVEENRKISERLQSKYQKSLFRQLAGIDNIYGIDLKPYLQQIREAKHIIIYGAGFATEEVVKQLTTYRIEILGFAVSNKEDKDLALYGHHVYEISELISYSQEALVLIAANKKYNDEIIELLEKIGFDNYIKLNVEI